MSCMPLRVIVTHDPPPSCLPACLPARLQGLLDETADQPVAGNQLVAVLRQLQGMVKR